MRAVVLLLGLAFALPAAGQSIPVSVGGNASSLVGVDFDVPIEVDLSARAELLGGIALRVTWNPAVLEFVRGEPAAFGDLTANQDSLADGVLRLSGANPGGLGGRFRLATARFRPLTADTTTLGLAVGEFYAAGSFTDLVASVVPTGRQYCPARGRWGDLDADGAANSRDALITLSAAIGVNVAPFDAGLGDVDADGATQARDALIILSYGVGLDVSGFRLFTIASGACGVPVAALAIDPGAVTLLPGQIVRFAALASDGGGAAIGVNDVFWFSSNLDVAVIGQSGELLAVDTGTATVRAVRSGGLDTAFATVTVTARRAVHWVSALAGGQRNQLGSSALPFGAIDDAIHAAGPGDTIRVLPGRYVEVPTVDRPVVVWGDTSGGAARPLVGDPSASVGLDVQSSGRAEVHNLRIDSMTTGVSVGTSDTVVLRNLEYRGGYYSQSAAVVGAAAYVRMEHVRFYAAAANYYSSDGIRFDGPRGVLVIDSSEISGFAGRGVDFYDGDSLHVHASRITDNNSVGIYGGSPDSARAYSFTLSHSRIERNAGGQVALSGVRGARFDHNVLTGGGGFYYDLIYFDGFRSSVVSFFQDSLASYGGYWMDGYEYDSLLIDSVSVNAGGATGYLSEGRRSVIRDSRFVNVTGSPLDVYHPSGERPAPFGVWIERSSFEGPSSTLCDQCGYGVEGYDVPMYLTDVTFDNIYSAVRNQDSLTSLTRVTMTNVEQGVYQYCGAVNADSLSVEADGQAIYMVGCQVDDSIAVTRSTLMAGTQAIYMTAGFVQLRSSTVTAPDGIYTSYGVYGPGQFVVDSNVMNVTSIAVDLYASDSLKSVSVRDNLIQCVGTGTYGAYLRDFGGVSVERNTISGCAYGVYTLQSASNLPLGTPVRIAGNRILNPSYATDGIYASGQRAALEIVSDTVEGEGGNGAIYVVSAGTARVDSNVVLDPVGTGIRVQNADSIWVRENEVTDTVDAPCCGTFGAIVLDGTLASNQFAEVSDNHVRGSSTYGLRLLRGNTTDTTRVQVLRNFVQGVDSVGILVSGYARADLLFNTVDSTGIDGVRFDRTNTDSAAVGAHNNNITRSGRYGMMNVEAFQLDAIANWWGDPLGPSGTFGDVGSLGDSVNANVAWAPPLGAPDPGAPISAPPMMLPAPRAMPVVARVPSAGGTSQPAPPGAVPASASPRVLRLHPAVPDHVRERRAHETRRERRDP